jgi:hypothetical protein
MIFCPDLPDESIVILIERLMCEVDVRDAIH